eukprot:46885-Eustigmatos_ZCMA.PRE.1
MSHKSPASLSCPLHPFSGFLQTARRVEAVVGLSRGDASESQLQTLEEAHAILQHHDAVAGTAKQHVSYDYAER